MWVRGIVGIILCLVGAVWIAQGTNALKGSGTTGHGQYAAAGIIVVVIGVALLAWAAVIGSNRT